MRDAAAQLMTRKRLGRDVFARGMPEPTRVTARANYEANVYDLLKAYSQQRQRTAITSWKFRRAPCGRSKRREVSSSVCSASPAIGCRSISFSPSFSGRTRAPAAPRSPRFHGNA